MTANIAKAAKTMMEIEAGQTEEVVTDTAVLIGETGADTAVVEEDTTTSTITEDVVEGQAQAAAITEGIGKVNLPGDTTMRPRPRLEARL